jgi:hypothetical protein
MDDGIVNLVNFCMDDGIQQVVFSQSVVNFCMDDGIVPVSLLLLKSKVVMLDRLPISIGISMDKEL